MFTLGPIPYRILANRTRRVDFASVCIHTTNDRPDANGTRTGPRVNTSASALRPVVTQLDVLNSWHRPISRFPGHMSFVSSVEHVLTKETSGKRCSTGIWSIYTSCV